MMVDLDTLVEVTDDFYLLREDFGQKLDIFLEDLAQFFVQQLKQHGDDVLEYTVVY